MKKIEGDLIELAVNGKFDVIVHGCNCFCKMGKGIAKQIANSFPDALKIDLETKVGDKSKLGDYSFTSVVTKEDSPLFIINAYTQYNYGTGKDQVDYNAIRQVFKRIKENFKGKRIGYPKIGAGLAGGNWSVISAIINKELSGENHTLVIYKQQKQQK